MTSFVNLLTNDVWSDADITNRVRSQVESIVPVARQDELRTILLGHIAQMRTATPEELAEITLVKTLTEQAAIDAAAARADMILLSNVILYESAIRRLELPVVADDVTDADERVSAQAIIDSALPEVLNLHTLRNE